MLQFTRSGPRLLRLKGPRGLAEWICRQVDEAVFFDRFDDLNTWRGYHTAVFCSDGQGAEQRLRVSCSSGTLLAQLLNAHMCGLVEEVHRLPRLHLFRLAGEPERAAEQLCRRFGGQPVELNNLFDPWPTEGISLCLTDKNLRRPVGFNDLYPYALRLTGDPERLIEELNRQALNLFNLSMGDRPWSLLEVKAYDSYGRYDLQRRRLIQLFEGLDTGLILSEGWGRDYGRVLIPLQVYTFKLYTYLTAAQLKRLLVGLEWDDFGNRLADYDLYEGKKKIDWGQAKAPGEVDREVFKAHCRSEVKEALDDQAFCTQLEIETSLRAAERAQGGRPKEE